MVKPQSDEFKVMGTKISIVKTAGSLIVLLVMH